MPELLPCAPGSPEWLAARRQGVTATDIVTILGLSSWNSPYSLFWQKMGQVPEPGDNDRFRLGRELQDYVCERWTEVSPNYGLRAGGLYRSSARSWQMATPDQLVGYVGTHTDPIAVLEVKTWADADKPAWGKGMVYDEHGPLIHDDQVPAAVRAQVLWQMDVMDVSAGHVGVVFLPSGEFRSYTIEHRGGCDPGCNCTDPDPCPECVDTDLMRLAGVEFMDRLRLELPAPDPDASAASLAAVRARFARQPDKTAEVDGMLWALYNQACHKIDYWTEEKRGHEAQIREQAGEASVLTVDGQPVARRIVGDAPVKAHTRHSDYLRRIAPKETDSE